MISADDVYNSFLTLVPQSAINEAPTVLQLCSTSLEKLLKTLRSDADLSDIRISYAAACDAFYSYALSAMADIEENSDFKAGDITVKRKLKETLEVAERVKNDGREAIKELLCDNSFGAWSV